MAFECISYSVDMQEMGYFASKSICFQIKVYSSIYNHVLQLFGKIGCALSTFCVLVFLSFTYQHSVAFCSEFADAEPAPKRSVL